MGYITSTYPDVRKVRGLISTVDHSTRRVEATLKEGAIVQVAIWEGPILFRWPKVGEIWTLIYENGYWTLGSYIDKPDESARIEDLEEDEARIHATQIRLIDNKKLVSVDEEELEDKDILQWDADIESWTRAAAGNHTHSQYVYTGGNGLTLTGQDFSVNVDDSTLEISSDALRVKALGITDSHVAAANKDGVAGTASMRTLGTGAQQAAAGNHSHSSFGDLSVTSLTTTSGSVTSASNLYLDNSSGTGSAPPDFRLDGYQDALYVIAESDANGPTATSVIFRTASSAGTAANRVRVASDGKLEFWSGSVWDVNLYRGGAGLLKTDDVLDLSGVALETAAAGTGIGDKLSLYLTDYGFGMQAGRLVAFTHASAAFAVRPMSATGHSSSGTDAVTLWASGNVDATGKLKLAGNAVLKGESAGVMAVRNAADDAYADLKMAGLTLSGASTFDAQATFNAGYQSLNTGGLLRRAWSLPNASVPTRLDQQRMIEEKVVSSVDWTTPTIGGVTTQYALQLVGWVKPLYTETYTFYATSDDGVRMFVNDQEMFTGGWKAQGATEYSGTIALTAGRWYPILVEHYQGIGASRLKLEWYSTSQVREVIPSTGLAWSSTTENNPHRLTIGGDTNLYRGGANLLTTDDALTVTGTLTASSTLTASATGKTAITISDSGAQSSGLTIGTDTNLYRSGPSILATDDSFYLVGTDNLLRNFTSGIGYSAITRTMGGVELGAAGMNGTSKFTSALKFLSTDPEFTTENPKLLAHVVGRATEAYTADTDGGMALDFGVTANDPGTTNVPVVGMSLLPAGLILGTTTATTTSARLTFPEGTTVAEGIYFGTDTNLYRGGAHHLKTDDVLDLTSTAGDTTASGTGIGDKLALYSTTYGFGIQSARLVAYVDATNSAFSVRVDNASGQSSSGTDAVTLWGSGNVDATGKLKLGGNAVLKGEASSVMAVRDAADSAYAQLRVATTPSNANDATSKSYVDTNFSGVELLAPAPNGTDDTTVLQDLIDQAWAAAEGVTGSGPDVGGAVVRLRYCNEDKPYICSQLILRNRVTLEGQNPRGTVIRQKASTASKPLIVNDTSTDDGATDPNARWVQLKNLTLDGDKANQTTANNGIFFDRNPDWAVAYADLTYNNNDNDWDGHYLIENVHIKRCKGTGLETNGLSAGLFVNIQVNDCDEHGISCGVDNHFVNCDCGQNGLAGFYLNSTSCTLVGCKSWYSGNVDPSYPGFLFDNGYQNNLQGCVAQDNKGPAVYLTNAAYANRIDVVSDSNHDNAAAASGVAIWIDDYCDRNMIDVVAHERYPSGAFSKQRYAVHIDGANAEGNLVRVTNTLEDWTNGPVLTPTSNQDAKSWVVNDTYESFKDQGDKSGTFVPDVFKDGRTQAITVVGALTIGAPTHRLLPGHRLSFYLAQNATGGNAVTWDAAYTDAPVVSTTANAVTSCTFVWHGSGFARVN